MSIKKVMIVIWRWPEPNSVQYQIKGEENNHLFTVTYDPPVNYLDLEHEHLSWQQKVHRDLMFIFQQFNNEIAEVKYLILVHDVSPFKHADFKLFLSKHNLDNKQVIVEKFSDGNGYIYIDHLKKTGLIASNGLAKNSPYLSPDSKKLTISVVDEQGLIESDYFIGVWNNYYLLNKDHFKDAYYLISLLPFDRLSRSKQSLRKFIQQQNGSRLESFFRDHDIKEPNDDCKHIQNLSALQGIAPETADAYLKLCMHFDEVLNTPDYFKKLNNYFIHLINLLP